jgi:hypothetical protein
VFVKNMPGGKHGSRVKGADYPGVVGDAEGIPLKRSFTESNRSFYSLLALGRIIGLAV